MPAGGPVSTARPAQATQALPCERTCQRPDQRPAAALSLLLNHGELLTLGFASLSLRFSSCKMETVVSALWAGGKRGCNERLCGCYSELGHSVCLNKVSSLPSVEKEMATHPSLLAWRIPWAEEHGRPVCGVARVGHN